MYLTHEDLAMFRTNYMGLSQGSYLSPFLNNLYANNDQRLAVACTIRQFADDRVVSVKGPRLLADLQRLL